MYSYIYTCTFDRISAMFFSFSFNSCSRLKTKKALKKLQQGDGNAPDVAFHRNFSNISVIFHSYHITFKPHSYFIHTSIVYIPIQTFYRISFIFGCAHMIGGIVGHTPSFSHFSHFPPTRSIFTLTLLRLLSPHSAKYVQYFPSKIKSKILNMDMNMDTL